MKRASMPFLQGPETDLLRKNFRAKEFVSKKIKKCNKALALGVSCGRLAAFTALRFRIQGCTRCRSVEGRESYGRSRYMGLVLLVVIWLITFVSTYFFIVKKWWLPTGASAAAAGIDHHFATTYLLMGIVFVAAQVSLRYFHAKYR